jgi:predicted RNA-binding protein YlxR (DUF448 family)
MSPKRRHIPQRTCVACREVKDKRDLIRIVRTPEHRIIVDETGKAHGRGAYLCKQLSCWQKGLSRGIINRTLKVSISDEDLIALEKYSTQFS